MDRREPEAAAEQDNDGTERVIPVVEETVRVGKRVVERKRRIAKRTRVDDQYVETPLVQEEAEIKRVPIGKMLEGPVSIRHEGDTTIIPVIEEVLVVEKRLFLKEEIHIVKQRTEVREVRHVPLRKTEITIEEIDES